MMSRLPVICFSKVQNFCGIRHCAKAALFREASVGDIVFYKISSSNFVSS